jgi:hypothetical protein
VVSQRDLRHVVDALWRLSRAHPDAGVAVADINAAVGRGHGDMRTPLNLQSLQEDGRVRQSIDGGWCLTEHGLAWLEQDRELSG